jgi:hypothetical protein
MRPKYLKYKTRTWAMMLKNFRISRPDGGLDPHVGQGYWEGDGAIFLRTQWFGGRGSRQAMSIFTVCILQTRDGTEMTSRYHLLKQQTSW